MIPTESPVFIVGCPRSGTSLLRDLLRSHPKLALPDESHFIPFYYYRYGDPRSEYEAIRLAEAILGEHWIRWWQVPMKASQFRRCRSFAEVVSTLFGIYAEQHGKSRWGDKTPQYVEHLPLITKLFPQAKILHVIRDGRDVALSWQNPWFGPKNSFHAAKLWKQYVTAGISAGRKLPAEQYLEVRYERLITEPEKFLKRICDFIGETYDPAVLTPTLTERQMGRKRIFSKRKRTQLRSIDSSKTEHWKTLMVPTARCRFEIVAAGLLTELGYEIEGYPRRQLTPVQEGSWVFLSLLRSNAARLNRSYTYTDWLPGMLKRTLSLIRSSAMRCPKPNKSDSCLQLKGRSSPRGVPDRDENRGSHRRQGRGAGRDCPL